MGDQYCASDVCTADDTGVCCIPRAVCNSASIVCSSDKVIDTTQLCAGAMCNTDDTSDCCKATSQPEPEALLCSSGVAAGQIECDPDTSVVRADQYCASDVCTADDT